jgi:chromatin remodeling complex protein RSC6
MDSAKISTISEAILKVGESLVALSAAIASFTNADGTAAAAVATENAATPKKRAPRVHTPVPITEELANFIGKSPGEAVTRPDAEAAVMDYIRQHNLQDPSDKRKITPDDELAKLFNSDAPITVLTLKGAIKHHFITAA